MKKYKLKDRLNNAFNVFFDKDFENMGENGLTCANYSKILKHDAAVKFDERADVLVKALKRAFIFFPGSIYLFFFTFSIFSFEFLQDLRIIFSVFFIGSLMTIFGIGSLKNPKHLVIPISVVSVATLAILFFWILEKPNYVFEYGIYFFPAALIAPFLAKGLVERRENKNSEI